jgi:hypothetical protein
MSNETNAPAVAPALSLREKLLALKAQQEIETAKRQAAGVVAPKLATGRTIDNFGSPVGTGTHSMHVVLAEAYSLGLWLSRKQIQEQSNYGNMPNHLNTMRGKGRVIAGERGQWRLSDAAGQHWHGEGKMFGFALETAAQVADASEAVSQQTADDSKPNDETPPAESIDGTPINDTPPQADDETPRKGKGKKGK